MIQRQLRNLFWLHSYSLPALVRHFPEFAFYYLFKGGRAPMPLNITLELTNRCNLNCKGCFVEKAREHELTYNQWTNFIKGVSSHTKSFYIAGGEPFMRDDIYDILHLLRKQGARFGLTTNGTLVDAAKLAGTGITYIIFSLDGPKRVHDSIRGAGVYDKLMGAMAGFMKHRTLTRVFINTMINPLNYHMLSHIPAIAKRLRVDGVSLQHFVYTGRKEFNIPLLQSQIAKWQSKCRRLRLRHYYKPYLNSEQVGQWYTNGYAPPNCFLPWNLIRVNPQGGVYFCYPYTKPVGNVTRQSLPKILNSKAAIGFRSFVRHSKKRPGCLRCCKG